MKKSMSATGGHEMPVYLLVVPIDDTVTDVHVVGGSSSITAELIDDVRNAMMTAIARHVGLDCDPNGCAQWRCTEDHPPRDFLGVGRGSKS